VCEAGRSPCGGIFVNTSNSATNCGTCGHGCLLGTCSGGVCQPYVLAMGLGTPTSIAIDSTSVYVTNGLGANAGTIEKIVIADGKVTTLVPAGNQTDPQSIAVDANYLY
jgi:hypothetical protein